MQRRLLDWIASFGSEEAGQGATEYMLMISVVVIALTSGAYTFVPVFKAGVGELGSDVARILRTGKINGIGGTNGAGFRGTTGRPSLMHAAPNEGVPYNLIPQLQRDALGLKVPMDPSKGYNSPANRAGNIG